MANLISDVLTFTANWVWKNKEWIFSGIGIPIAVWIGAKILKRKRTFIKVDVIKHAAIIQLGTHFENPIPSLTIKITNLGNEIQFIQEPLLLTSRKIYETNLFKIFSYNNLDYKFPFRLESGQELSLKVNPQSLEKQILKSLENKDYIRFLIKNTLNKKYYSCKMQKKELIEFNNNVLNTSIDN